MGEGLDAGEARGPLGPQKSMQYSVLHWALMNAECHTWVSVCVVLTSTRDKHFQWIHLTAVYCNIETKNRARNHNHLSRVYLFHTIIHLKYVANLFLCFQLDTYCSFCSLKTIQNWMSCHQ